MGGCCCCASQGAEFNNPPPLSQYPRALEGGVPLSSNYVPVSVLSTGLLVNTNFDTTPETYRPPPEPMPLPNNSESHVNKNEVQSVDRTLADANSGRTQEATLEDTKFVKIDQSIIELCAVKEVADVLDKCGDLKQSCNLFVMEEEDVCPTCLEVYDTENPKIITRCQHHFHLACILEWMERSDTCPVCDKATGSHHQAGDRSSIYRRALTPGVEHVEYHDGLTLSRYFRVHQYLALAMKVKP